MNAGELIIDCHIHPASAPSEDFRAFGQSGSPEDQVAALRRAGIGRACGGVILRPDAGPDYAGFAPIKQMNDSALRLRDRLGDFYLPGFQVHPDFPQESCRELERGYAAGVRWVGELVGYLMKYDYDRPGMAEILQAAGTLGLPVNFHCDNLELIEALCRQAPQTNLVLAHPGDLGGFRARIDVVARHPNLYLDLSGTGLMRWGMLRHALDTAGAEKILFGTDFPICNPAMYVHCVAYEDLTPAERRLVLADNFLRLSGEAPAVKS